MESWIKRTVKLNRSLSMGVDIVIAKGSTGIITADIDSSDDDVLCIYFIDCKMEKGEFTASPWITLTQEYRKYFDLCD